VRLSALDGTSTPGARRRVRRSLGTAVATLAALLVATLLSGCEINGVTSKSISSDILDNANRICGPNRDSGRGGVENIMLLQDKEDDGIVTCHDGTNHYFDG